MEDLIRVFRSLSDPTRLRIVRLLLERELCVCELMFILKMEQSRISHQLRLLRDADLVEDKRQGRWIVYGIPKDVRKNLAPLFQQLIQKKRADSKVILQDFRALRTCLLENVRKRRRSII